MTTPCEVILYAPTKPPADAAASAILQEAKRLEHKYNYYDKASYLSQINQRLTHELDSETKTILQRAKQYYHATKGIFDITVATLKPLYTASMTIKELQQKREALLPYVGCDHFEIKKSKIYFDNKHTTIDLGGFVKEYAIDQSLKILKKYKITSALVNFGGDVYALGKKPDGEKFRIGITDPTDKQQHIKYFDLENQALTTSASYERNYTIETESFSHIIEKDQHTDKPLSVTVISQNCVESGVYSTALMINPELTTVHEVFIVRYLK